MTSASISACSELEEKVLSSVKHANCVLELFEMLAGGKRSASIAALLVDPLLVAPPPVAPLRVAPLPVAPLLAAPLLVAPLLVAPLRLVLALEAAPPSAPPRLDVRHRLAAGAPA